MDRMTDERPLRCGALPLPPMGRLAIVIMLYAVVALTALWLATGQPWIGLVMSPGDDGLIVLRDVQRNDLPSPLQPGSRVTQLGAVKLMAQDFTEEPDTLDGYDALNAFRARQTLLLELVNMPRLTLAVARPDGMPETVAIAPYASRPAWSLPFEFWLQLLVGGAGALLGGWVWVLKRDAASRFFAVSGMGLMLSAVSASVYSTRELALDGGLLRLLAAGNYAGTNIFGLALISLLLVYPNRIGNRMVIGTVWAVGLALTVAQLLQLMPSQAMGTYAPMLAQFILLFLLIGTQLYLSRRNPLGRAALGWFGLSILLGTAVFVFAIALPVLLGLEPQVKQAHAFAIILLIHAGLAIGVARYRLFDLGIWSFRLISYLIGGFLLIALDAVLIYVVAIERIPAFGIALLAVGMLYLPLRNVLGGLMTRRGGVDPARFRQIVDIALARDADQQDRCWRNILQESFAPLAIELAPHSGKAQFRDGGQELLVPATGAAPALVMRFADAGRRLFSQADADRVQELVDLMSHALESRDAHERGARQERSRMARDLHDNIGAQLLRTLHSTDLQRKDAIVGETLTDLRDIISHSHGGGMKLGEILAELRFETDERLNAVGIGLDWQASHAEDLLVDARMAHSIRSIVREAASNAIRHSGARRFGVDLEEHDGQLTLALTDNGEGFAPAEHRQGGGLSNMTARAEGQGGTIAISGTGGTFIQVRLPLRSGEA